MAHKRTQWRLIPFPDGLINSMTLKRLEWVGILAPLAFLVLYAYLLRGPAHGLFLSFWGLVTLVTILTLLVAGFARLMFRFVERLQRNVEELSRVAASQNAQLKALNEANLALSQERLLSAVLQRVVDLSRELVQGKYAALSVVGEDGGVKSFLTSGIDEATRKAMGALPTGKGLLRVMLERSEPLRLDVIADHPASVGFPPGHPDMKTFLGAPIRYQGQAVGSLYLAEKRDGSPFTQSDEEVVQLFANQVAVAIQNAHLYERLQALAVETERVRLSREMHDGLAQVLGYVNTKAQAAEAFLTRGEVAMAQEQVRELSKDARRVYQDVREGMLALRSQLGEGRTLRGVLEEYVSEFEIQLRRPVQMSWPLGDGDLALTPLQEVQVLRIVQEALANVRKHAEAGQVWVSFAAQDGHLEVEVRDDGKGFNPLAVRRGEWPHLGLQTMQERAEGIGGAFELESAPGRGTVVRVRIPHGVGVGASGGSP